MSEIRSQATPAKDELAEAIKGYGKSFLGECEEVDVAKIEHSFDCMADGLADYLTEDDGWSKPRTVNAPSEFEALPVGSVVLLTSRRAGHVAWQKQEGDRWCEASNWECSMTSLELWAVNLPATVLFTPGDMG